MGAFENITRNFGSDPLSDREPVDGVGLCLSGGGFKAAMFHTGALIRLNEFGALPELDRISSVSGGSITAAWLGIQWNDLTFSESTGVASNFHDRITAPLTDFARQAKIDTGSIISGIRRRLFGTAPTGAQKLAESYRELLFGDKTLLDLPLDKNGIGEKLAPRFIINASSVQHNSLWRMSRRYTANYRVGVFDDAPVDLASAVAASSAFPPVLSPAELNLEGALIREGTEGDLAYPPYSTRPLVADAGVYDNLGLETVWKKYRTILVSNAGDPFKTDPSPRTDWLSQSRRVMSMMHRNEENHRVRWLISMAKANQRRVALWSLRGRASDFELPDAVALKDIEAEAVAQQEVRLRPLEENEIKHLIHHGYSLCDASVRTFWKPDALAPIQFPPVYSGGI